MRGIIELHGLEFHAYHGIYTHERSSGNKFEVNVVVEVELQDTAIQDYLSGTLNYEDLYAVIKKGMEKPSHILEHVGYQIAEKIITTFSSVFIATVSIAKFNPPIGGVCKKAIVTVSQKRKQE